MAIIDNTLAAQIPTFDPATPLKQAAQLQAADNENRQAQYKQAQLEIGSEARGLQTFVNTPEFPQRWAETADRLHSKGLLDDRAYSQWRNTPSPLLLKQMIASTDDPSLAFRKQESIREQGNSDRNYLLAKRTQDRLDTAANETVTDKADERAAAGSKFGLDPATPQGRTFALTGKLPEADNDFSNTVDQRKRAAVANGLDPNSPGYQSYVLTGKMPREDAQPLTATDKKAILEADEKVQAGNQTIDNLNKAKVLSKEAMSGPMAGKLGYAASFLGESSDIGKKGIATQDLENLVTSNALQQLKTIFGGNPTEGERGILLDIQGSVGKPDAVRQKIFDRAIEAAKKRLTFEQQRADEIRGGSFYKKEGGMSKASTQGKGGDAMLQQARDAIAAGAPRDAVIKRLQDAGVDASGL